MKTYLPISINTIIEAKEFLVSLCKNGEAYHPDESAHEIVWGESGPTPLECDRLDQLMEEVFNLEGFDPYEVLLKNTVQ